MRSFDEWFDENCDGSDLAKDACRKLWDEFSDQINIICRKSYEKKQSKVDELQKRVDASLIAFEKLKDEINELHGQCDLHLIKYLEEKSQVLEQALKGGNDEAN